MTTARRVAGLMEQLGLEQGDLAARAQVTQGTISKIISGRTKNSRHLPRIARALGTTVDYLHGETDDPTGNALCEPLPPPLPQSVIIMQVVLPPEQALVRMFLGLLKQMPERASMDEQAELLARRLPIGLSALRDLLPPPSSPQVQSEQAALEELATHDPEPQS